MFPNTYFVSLQPYYNTVMVVFTARTVPWMYKCTKLQTFIWLKIFKKYLMYLIKFVVIIENLMYEIVNYYYYYCNNILSDIFLYSTFILRNGPKGIDSVSFDVIPLNFVHILWPDLSTLERIYIYMFASYFRDNMILCARVFFVRMRNIIIIRATFDSTEKLFVHKITSRSIFYFIFFMNSILNEWMEI